MPRQAREKSQSGVYHVMLRGINRQQVFFDEEDNEAFLAALKRIAESGFVKVYAYCLMGNHAHLILRERDEPLPAAMKRLGVSFVRFYNVKYARTGALFQDRYRCEPIEDRQALANAIRYVHMNPVKAALCGAPEDYPWSSHREYENAADGFVCTDEVLRMIGRDGLFAPVEADGAIPLIEPTEPQTGLTDARAREIIMEVCGCPDASAFGRLNARERARALCALFERELSASQICRLTGVSYAIARKYQP